MPPGIGYGSPPPMGGANPANLEQMAAAGDPRAIAMLRQMAVQGGAGGPGGGVPPGGPGMAPPGISPAPAMGAAPSMSQAEFSGYGRQPPQDQASRQAAQQIQLLRMLAAREQGQ